MQGLKGRRISPEVKRAALLECAAGKTVVQVTTKGGFGKNTVQKWVSRAKETGEWAGLLAEVRQKERDRLEGIVRAKRGAPKRFTGKADTPGANVILPANARSSFLGFTATIRDT